MTTAYQFLSAWITSRIDDERAPTLVDYPHPVALSAGVSIAPLTAHGETASAKSTEDHSSLGAGSVTGTESRGGGPSGGRHRPFSAPTPNRTAATVSRCPTLPPPTCSCGPGVW